MDLYCFAYIVLKKKRDNIEYLNILKHCRAAFSMNGSSIQSNPVQSPCERSVHFLVSVIPAEK